ncbi:cell wall hydrolase, partial [Bacillus sp. D-CC]
GRQGEQLVGCVVVNRVFCDCLDFKQLRTVRDAVYQSPGGFEAVQYGYFYQRARESEKEIARKVLQGEWRWPARWALWYFRPVGACPPQWYNQEKNTEFYNTLEGKQKKWLVEVCKILRSNKDYSNIMEQFYLIDS